MTIQTAKTPFQKMSFTPDIPSSALGPNEYNIGLNVETDTRGIKKIYGEQDILSQIPSEPLFITGNFRSNNVWWFVVGCLDGLWFGITSSGIINLTPTVPEYISDQYTHSTPITANWNGDVLFINDNVNPPMYLLPTDTEIRLYDSSYIDQTPNTFVWNYNTSTNWTDLTAGFQRVYSAPNIGSVLVAGNLKYTIDAVEYNAPNTIRWSQSFGLNSGPTTWEPTLNNVANEVDVPVRGPILDGFAINGNFYIFSYWDCCVLTPIAYTNTAAPVFGISPVTQNRGILNENCFAINDGAVFGLDSSDIWILEQGTFREIGNQRVKNWFYSNLNPNSYDQVFLCNNTHRNQIEIYFPDLDSTDGRCNKMLSYRYDLDCWNSPRDTNDATQACESPVFDSDTNQPALANRGVVYVHSGTNTRIVQKDITNGFFDGNTSTNINAYFRRDNINFGEPYSNKVQTHRILPEVLGTGTFTLSIGGALSVGQTPSLHTTATIAIDTDYPWIQSRQNSNRVTTVIASTNDSTGTWILTQANWQITVTEDDR
jgi:hypothetical protein